MWLRLCDWILLLSALLLSLLTLLFHKSIEFNDNKQQFQLIQFLYLFFKLSQFTWSTWSTEWMYMIDTCIILSSNILQRILLLSLIWWWECLRTQRLSLPLHGDDEFQRITPPIKISFWCNHFFQKWCGSSNNKFKYCLVGKTFSKAFSSTTRSITTGSV